MNFGLNTTQLYLNHLKSRVHDEQIITTARDLIDQVSSLEAIDKSQISYRLATPADLEPLKKIITVAYNGRYANEREKTTFSFDEVSSGEDKKTAIAVYSYQKYHIVPPETKLPKLPYGTNGNYGAYQAQPTESETVEIILGTLRLVSGQLELFDFFTPAGQWPYEAKNLRPCEFERLAFHPLFDLTRDDELRGEILRGLITTVTADLDLDKSWLVCTMSPNVKNFMDRIHVDTREMTDVRLSNNERTRYQLEHWPTYWQAARPYEVFLKDDGDEMTEPSLSSVTTTNSPANPQPAAQSSSQSTTDEQIWQELITHEWNLDWVRSKLTHPLTLYPGRPVIMSAAEVTAARIFDFSDNGISINLLGRTIEFTWDKWYSIVPSTHAKLQENLSATSGPVASYLRQEFTTYNQLKNKTEYGWYAFYFTRSGELEAVVQFPELPTFKLALASSSGQLLQNQDYTSSWLGTRQLFARSHILVAGASVASATAENLIRDGRIGYLTIGDPKAPNATNFNRTNYDAIDIGSGEPKAVSFARRLHRQDPTQIIYLAADGFHKANFLSLLNGDQNRPVVDVVVEAIDTLPDKLAIWELAGSARVPVVQVSDVGSVAQLTFQNAHARERGESLVFGLPDEKLKQLLTQDFIQVAARMVGLENAIKDEMGRFVAGKKNTPFGVATPQLGSTASVAAGITSEKILRYLLDRSRRPDFPYRRIAVDKKNNLFKSYHWPSLKERILALVLEWRSRHQQDK